MCQYATLYAHSKRLGIPALIDPKMHEVLKDSFPDISIPSYPSNCSIEWTHLHWTEFDKLRIEDFQTKNIMLYNWNLFVGHFKFYQHKLITEEFAFQSEMKLDVEDFFRNVSLNLNLSKEIIFVGVHARRNDFKDWMKTLGHGGFVASQKFYLSAMEFYQNKYDSSSSKTVFIMASDEDQWCRKMFGNMSDVVFTSSSTTPLSRKQPTFDLAALSHCNHSIIR
jgi:hypothetical protein